MGGGGAGRLSGGAPGGRLSEKGQPLTGLVATEAELASSCEGGQPRRRRREAGYGGPLDHTEGGGPKEKKSDRLKGGARRT